MDNTNSPIDETLLTGAEGYTSCIDERTLACTPAPMAASTVGRERGFRRQIPQDTGGSFLKSLSPEVDNNLSSSDDRSSLGLLPSNCLLETDLLRKDVISLSQSILLLDTPGLARAPVNSSSNNLYSKVSSVESASSREQTSDSNSHDFPTTVKKCPQGAGARQGGRYIPQALFQSVEEENEQNLEGHAPEGNDVRQTHESRHVAEEFHQTTDSGMGQTNFTGSKFSYVGHSGMGQTVFAGSHHELNQSGDKASSSSMPDSSKTQTLAKLFDGGDADENSLASQTSQPGEKSIVSFESKRLNESRKNEKLSFSASDFAGVLSRAITFVQTTPEIKGQQQDYNQALEEEDQDEADHTINVIELEAEDLKELEQSFSDLENDFSDEELSPEKVERANSQEMRLDILNEIKTIEENSPKIMDAAFPFMDGPFKIPLPPKKPLTLNKLANEPFGPNATSSANHSPDAETSNVFVDSITSHQTNEQTTEWGPSIQFADSVQLPETPLSCKGIHQATWSVDENKQNDNQNSQSSYNPFGDFDNDFNEDFGGEDFMEDSGAVAAMLEEDEQQFKKDHLDTNEFFSTTLGSVRGDDQTFMNMTIATYMGAKSEEMGSLTSCKRPDLGMPVFSPPSTRVVNPIISPEKISSPEEPKTKKPTPSVELKQLPAQLRTFTKETNLMDDSIVFPLSQQSQSPPISLKPNFKQFTDNITRNLSPVFDRDSQIFDKPPLNFIDVPTISKVTKTNSEADTKVMKSTPFAEVTQNTNTPSSSPRVKDSKDTYPDSSFSNLSQYLREAQDMTVNSTATDLTFSSLHKLLEKSQFNMTNPEKLILSEVEKKVDEKKAARSAVAKENKLPKPEMSFVEIRSAAAVSEASLVGGKDGSKYKQGVVAKSEGSSSQVRSPVVSKEDSVSDAGKAGTRNTMGFEGVDTQNKADAGEVSPVFKVPFPVSSSLLPRRNKSKSRIPRLAQQSSKPGSSQPRGLEFQESERSKDSGLPSSVELSHRGTELGSISGMTLLECSLAPGDLANSCDSTVVVDGKSDLPDHSSAGFKTLHVPTSHQSAHPQGKSSHPNTDMMTPAHIPYKDLSLRSHLSQIPEIYEPSISQSQKQLYSLVAEETNQTNMTLESVSINAYNSHLEAPHSWPTSGHHNWKGHPNDTLNFQPKQDRSLISNRTTKDFQNYEYADATTLGEDASVLQFHSLIQDNTQSILQQTELHNDFAFSTPMTGHLPNMKRFDYSKLPEKSILPLVTPNAAINFLELPKTVYFPDACCVHLSQQTSFPITNLLDKGIKCLLTFRDVRFNNQRITTGHYPFELKRQHTLSPCSTEQIPVMFRPKDGGEYLAVVEVHAQNLTSPNENRTYTLTLMATAELPTLKLSPVEDEIDFGDLHWGKSACRSIRVQNIGKATVPLRFSINRQESSLCQFTFQSERVSEMSMISFTTKPIGIGSVFAITLPGKKGDNICTETVHVYCHANDAQKVNRKYMKTAEKFHATLSLGVDMPVEDIDLLCVTKLRVNVGYSKLHVDKSNMSIYAIPGKSGQGVVKLINSGNITLPVDIYFEPSRHQFSVSSNHVDIPGGGDVPVYVTFTPQPTRDSAEDNNVHLMLQTTDTDSYISVVGKIRAKEVRISATVAALNFGGVSLGQTKKLMFTFFANDDADIKLRIGGDSSIFKFAYPDEASSCNSIDMKVLKDKQYSVAVSFTPNAVDHFSTVLSLQILYANRFTIPTSGYGGTSNLAISNITTLDAGEKWLDLGVLRTGTSILQKVMVRNNGVRCCFVKATCCDVSQLEFQPNRATVMPSALLLLPNESKELIVMFCPTQKEMDLCKSGRAIVAFIKITYGDEVIRQMFLANPGKHSRQIVYNFDIPLTNTQKQQVDLEMKNMSCHGDCYSFLKKSVTVVKIGLFGQHQEVQPVPHLALTETIRSPMTLQRPALTQVNTNIQPQQNRSKDDWNVAPQEIQLNVDDVSSKSTVQVINFSSSEIMISVDCDNIFLVSPTRTLLKARSTMSLNIGVNPSALANKSSAQCGLVRVYCQQEIKYIKVFIIQKPGWFQNPGMSPVVHSTLSSPHASPNKIPVTFSRSSVTPSQQHALAMPDYPMDLPEKLPAEQANVCSPSLASKQVTLPTDKTKLLIEASDKVFVPTTTAGSKIVCMYMFTNKSFESISWNIIPLAMPYVQYANSTSQVYRVDYEAFKLSPTNGTLQPNETAKITVQFSPKTKGSYNQAWIINDSTRDHSSLHKFTLYAKAIPSQLMAVAEKSDELPAGLSQTTLSHGKLSSHSFSSTASSEDHTRPPSAGSPDRGTVAAGSPGKVTQPRPAGSPGEVTQPRPAGSPGKVTQPRTANPDASPHSVKDSDPHVQLGRAKSIPSWSPVTARDATTPSPHSSSAPTGLESNTPSASSKTSSTQCLYPGGDNNSTRSGTSKKSMRCVHLPNPNLKFPTLHKMECAIVKLDIMNPSEATELAVTSQPNPPFLIKHTVVKLGKDKKVFFPVTFKPRHVAKFKDQLVFTELATGKTLTATLEAECVD